MTLEQAREVHETLLTSQLTSLRDDLVELAVRYARLRVDWLVADAETRPRLEEPRRHAHNALISACDILARNMAQRGEDATWRDRLGNDRKVIGDFACYLHAVLGVAAR